MTANNLRGKPTNKHKASLRKPQEADWAKLEFAVVQAILTNTTQIVLVLDYTTKLPEDFPIPSTIDREGLTKRYALNARRVLEWMNKHGKSSITLKMLTEAKRKFARGDYFKHLEIF